MVDRRLAVAFFFLAITSTSGQTPSANPLSDGTRFTYSIMKRYLTASADKMPEENYSFRPTPAVRSFAEFIGHVADSNFRLCSVIAGQNPIDAGNERSKSTKPELTKVLAESFTFCDKVYNEMTDSAGIAPVRFEAGVEGLRNAISMPKLTALSFLTQANFEHYGNLVTYMRLKNIVPPSSELPPPKAPAPRTDGVRRTYSDAAGDWNILVNTPNGPIAAVLTLKFDGGNVSGEIKSERGTVPVTGTLKSAELTFSGKSQTLAMTFTAKPGNESMSGKVEFAGHPSGTWTATRP
jgi:DinB family protein